MKQISLFRTRRPTQHFEWLNNDFGFFYTIKKHLLYYTTKYQTLELADTNEFGRVLLLDGITQAAQYGECYYHEIMVHPAMCCHPAPQNILVIGAGDGGVLKEVLKYSCVKSVELAELDKDVIEISKKYLKTIHKGSFNDSRVKINIVDGREYIEKNPKRFDVVIMDMIDPFGPARYLYTKEFFYSVKKSFRTNNGIFVMHSESPVTRPKTFLSIHNTLKSAFEYVCPFYAYIHMYATLWSITVSSDKINIKNFNKAFINQKLKKCKIKGLYYYTGIIHEASLATWPHLDRLLRKKSRILTDKHPTTPDKIIHK
jgi:spermidine synthase